MLALAVVDAVCAATVVKKKSTRQKTFLFQACGDRSGNGPLTEIAECRTRLSWSRDSIASRRLPSASSNRARHRRFAPRTAVGRFSGVAKSGKKQNGFKKVPTTCAGIDRNPRREPKKKFRKKNRCSKVFFGETPVSRRTTAPRFGFRQRALLRSRSYLKKVKQKPKTEADVHRTRKMQRDHVFSVFLEHFPVLERFSL